MPASVANNGCCRPALLVLEALGEIQKKETVSCCACPFPYCVQHEAEIIKQELKEHLVRIMRRLGSTMEETAAAMEVSLRSVYRYAGAYVSVACPQCNLVHSLSVMCKSNVYSVVCRGEQYTIILNKHRHATPQELKLVECFIDYVFPSSTVKRSTNGHDYWLLAKVELEEAKNFERMCNALNRYTLSLSRGTECIQQVR